MSFSSPDRKLDEQALLERARAAVADASCWVLTDGKAGDEVQCLGVVERLGLAADVRRVKPRRPWVWLMPRGPIDPQEAPDQPGSPLAPPWPDIVIASGRRAVSYVRHIRHVAGDRVLTVFLKDPGTGRGAADLIWVPAHDRIRGPNVISTLTSPHRLSPARLAEARAVRPPWVRPDQPTVGVMLGGDSRHHKFRDGDISALVGLLAAMASAGGHLVVTPSRRTPSVLAAAIHDLCAASGGWFWDGAGENPYLGILAHADHLVVTSDSVNMLGEGAATGRPIHLFQPTGGHTKISSFVSGLERHGAVRALSGRLESWSYEPLDATPAIAIAVADAFVARRGGTGGKDRSGA